jgi:hypothetical protein
LREDLPHEEKLRGENNKGAVSGVTSKLSVSYDTVNLVGISEGFWRKFGLNQKHFC